MRTFVAKCTFLGALVAVVGCSGAGGGGLVGPDPRGGDEAAGAAQELNERPDPGAKRDVPAPSTPADPEPAPSPSADAGAPPPPPPSPPTYYRLSIGGVARDPVASPDARRGSRYGDLEVHALLAKAQGVAPEETLDVQFPKDKIGSFACDADHRVVWVRPEPNKALPRVYATRNDAGCRVEITKIDPVGGWVEGSAQGTLVYDPLIGQTDQKPVSVVFRVTRTQ
jgi:hypothetical protein